VRLRYHSAQIPCAVTAAHGAGPHPGLELALGREVGGAAPGQTAVLMNRDRVVGWAPIAAPELPRG
jgi:tRNA U34 2-thiouridine synthase MnmA/TrmU